MEQLKVYAATLEEKAEAQIREMSQSDAYGDCLVRIMPDCHAGAGCTIGTVIALKDRIVPNTVGVDIGCGMQVVRLGQADIDLERLDRVVNNEIPSGFNIHEMILWAIRRFAGDFAMAGRFLEYALTPEQYIEMRAYSQKVSRNLQHERGTENEMNI